MILVTCGILGLACERAELGSADAGQALDLRLEDVEVRVSIGDTPQFAFHAARVWFDQERGRLQAQDVRGRIEPDGFAEVRP